MRLHRRVIAIGLTVLVGGWAAPAVAEPPRPGPQPPDAAVPVAFTGTVVFHQAGGTLTYRVRVAAGRVVGGQQDFGDRGRPFAAVVGGWFDRDQRKLCLLLQVDDSLGKKWRSQAQHLRVDEANETDCLEHALYGYGITDRNESIVRDHVLDLVEPGTPPRRPARGREAGSGENRSR